MSAARGSFLEVLAVFTRLGLTSFGGPIAHLGYFRAEIVERRGWLSDRDYADLVALCQFLPGPASSQVGIGLGYRRAGVPGAVAAWLGFTLPSAAALTAFAFGVSALGDAADAAWLHGLRIVAVAVVANAVWGMAQGLTPDRPRITVALVAAMVVLVWSGSLAQVAVICAGAIAGLTVLRHLEAGDPVGGSEGGPASATERDPSAHSAGELPGAPARPSGSSRTGSAILLAVFFALLALLPIARQASGDLNLAVADAFYRTGSLVFGGGHVVLPLIQAEVVPTGWVDESTFIAGYGAAQAVPGPLFTFAAYLGASSASGVQGLSLALVALLAVFLPSFLLVLALLPHWEGLRARTSVRRALVGVNAAVVGLLLAALYHPVWTSAILAPRDLALALAAFLGLALWKVAPWLVVVLGALTTASLAALGY